MTMIILFHILYVNVGTGIPMCTCLIVPLRYIAILDNAYALHFATFMILTKLLDKNSA